MAGQTMKIRILGAGPAGLSFAALMKRLDPSHDVAIVERSPRDATWGFGVVFSDRALEFLRADDEALYRTLTPHLETWPDITVARNDTAIPIAGNGFASIGRLELLTLLYRYVERLGVKLHFDEEITTLAQLGDERTSSSGRTARSRGCATSTRTGSARRSTGDRTGSSGTAARRPSTA